MTLTAERAPRVTVGVAIRNVVAWGALAAILAFTVFCLVWRVSGGRWERVETPSMATVAPVGSLLWTYPTDFAELESGDFITFHAPGNKKVTYSHLVYEVHDDGTLSTKGVIPSEDPWRLTGDDIVGKVVMNWPGIGWIVAAGPILLIGGFVVAGLRLVIPRDWKLPLTIVGAAVIISVAIVVHRPLLNAQQLSLDTESAPVVATYVGTGLLPVKVSEPGGDSIVLQNGVVGSLEVTDPDNEGVVSVELSPGLDWWWWVLLIAACFVPAAVQSVRPAARNASPPDESE